MDRNYLDRNWCELTYRDSVQHDEMYSELLKRYSEAHRRYHNLEHVYTLLKHADQYKKLLKCFRTVGFAIWYHDTIYDPSRRDNEEKSAELARNRLSQLHVHQTTIDDCYTMIMATKTHQPDAGKEAFDTLFLLDIDLSVLAVDSMKYTLYTKQIRQEYNMYPDSIYYIGRKNVLTHFLEMPYIYKTELFRDLWEDKARKNIRNELMIIRDF